MTNEEIALLATKYADEQNSCWTNDFYGFIAGFNKCMALYDTINNTWIEVKTSDQVNLPNIKERVLIQYYSKSNIKIGIGYLDEDNDPSLSFEDGHFWMIEDLGDAWIYDITHWRHLPKSTEEIMPDVEEFHKYLVDVFAKDIPRRYLDGRMNDKSVNEDYG